MIYFIIGLILGGGGVYFYLRPKLNRKVKVEKVVFSNEEEAQKNKNLEKIEAFIKGKDQFTNDDLQNLLKVSNTTTWRYLEELEHRGAIKHVGETGRSVFYKKS